MTVNWQDDPELQARIYEGRIRSGLIRSALFWTPCFLVVFGLLLYFVFDQLTGGDKGWFLVAILAIFSVLLGFQASQSLLDLRSAPVEATHMVVRRWSKSDSLVMRTHYVQLANKSILHGDKHILEGIKVEDTVVVRFYPHTGVILSMEKEKPKPVVPGEIERPRLSRCSANLTGRGRCPLS